MNQPHKPILTQSSSNLATNHPHKHNSTTSLSQSPPLPSSPNSLAQTHPLALAKLKQTFSGELDLTQRTQLLYATDASIYKEMPAAVAFPKNAADIQSLLTFAQTTHTPLIARGGGTSLAGQVVGTGIIVDVSLHMNQILEINRKEAFVRVQPGVIRDDLNKALHPHGLFFPPETASASRATIGGMIGNNSTGANSIVYGSTRDHILSIKGYLSDGSPIEISALSQEAYHSKLPPTPHPPHSSQKLTREQSIYHTLHSMLSDQPTREHIKADFPHQDITRRNSGYALDLLAQTAPFNTLSSSSSSSHIPTTSLATSPAIPTTPAAPHSPAQQHPPPFNLATLIAGSEGTLMFITEATLRLSPLPPAFSGIIAAHFESIHESLLANILALNENPSASELIDHYIIDCTKKNLEQRHNRDFIKGSPKAILIIEIRRQTQAELDTTLNALQKTLLTAGKSTHAPILTGPEAQKPWNIRKAGLGLLSNVVGDAKPIALVEDTAVRVTELPQFVKDFNKILNRYDLSCVHYAHAGAGELHLRPIVNIKTASGQATIRSVATDIAHLVKKYRGSLSGEHGDGRLRAEFIPLIFGADNYELFKTVKRTFDPDNLLNPHKITAAPKMNTQLRYENDDYTPAYETYLDFSPYQGMVRLAEMCNGSGECRRSHFSQGLMCPSYMATRDERHTTRARANILREILKNPTLAQPFAQTNVLTVLDLCLSCKGCKAQCPSNVDIAALKAEYLSHYYTHHKPSLRTRLFAHLPTLAMRTAFIPAWLKNSLLSLTTPLLKPLLKLNPTKALPPFSNKSGVTLINRHLQQHFKQKSPSTLSQKSPKTSQRDPIYFFIDEFTNVFDSLACEQTFLLLTRLGYTVKIFPVRNSGRSLLSAGFLKQAQKLARHNITLMENLLAEKAPETPSALSIVGIEPSALLTFRDEHIALLRGEEQILAQTLAKRTFLLEEFLAHELENGRIDAAMFPAKHHSIAYHTHCHQQSLSKPTIVPRILQLISTEPVQSLGEGCCGMAGTFGYEREHSTISANIANLRLLPALAKTDPKTLIVATGFSCREQIAFLSTHHAIHTGEAFYRAL